MDKLAFPYRSPTHLPLLHVIAEAGSWEKYGLDVTYDQKISSGDAHDAVAKGDIEFVGGNHVSTYGRRARGDRWVYLGQTVNAVPGRKVVVRADSGITKIEDLRLKKVGTQGQHPGLNDWLYLKQHGLDVDRDQVELVHKREIAKSRAAQPGGAVQDEEDIDLWKEVRDGTIVACFATAPATIYAQRAGLRLLDLDPFPMIFFTTISSGLPFVEKHPELVERFLKGLIEGIHFFQTQPEKSIATIRRTYTGEGELDEELATILYRNLAAELTPKLYPTPMAIANVYEEGLRQDKDAAKMNPMELWDLHFIRRLDDAGFVDQLYSPRP